jgi:hypothetical protein
VHLLPPLPFFNNLTHFPTSARVHRTFTQRNRRKIYPEKVENKFLLYFPFFLSRIRYRIIEKRKTSFPIFPLFYPIIFLWKNSRSSKKERKQDISRMQNNQQDPTTS